MFIYKITNTINGKVYIGMDSGPVGEMRRWNSHRTLYFRRKEQGKPVKNKIGRAILKYGIDAFRVEVIYQASDINDLVKAETQFIEEHDTVNSGYNMLPASQGYTLSSIDDPLVREYLRDIRRRGSIKANKERWENTTLNERREMTSHLHTPEMADKKARRMKEFWSKKTEKNISQLSGLKNQWIGLSLEERRERTKRAGGLFTAKSYIAVSPEGIVHQVDNMKEFCQIHNLTATGMCAVARGCYSKHKGWTCKVKDNK